MSGLSIEEVRRAKRPARRSMPVQLENGTTAEFVFQAIGRRRFEELRREHAPTNEQRVAFQAQSAGRPLGWNPDTFPPALLAACAVSPTMTVDDAQALWDDDGFSQAELAELLACALAVNQVRDVIDDDAAGAG